MLPAQLVGPGIREIASSVSGLKIPCVAARGMVFTAWTPSPEELAALNGGSMVWLVQRGPYIPDMTMRVGSEAEVIPHHLYQHAVDENRPGGDAYERAVEEFKKSKPTSFDRWAGRVFWFLLMFLLGCILRMVFA